jgi:hypothetical protein
MTSPQTIDAAFCLAIGSRGTAADLADSLRERDRTTAEELDLLAENCDRIAELLKQQA